MNVKQIIEVDIESNGMNGEGIAHIDGKVVFVPNTLKGERVRATVKSVKSRYATASVIKILSPSEYRVAPDCPHYFKCGGCDMLHISPDYRREVLLADLKNNLKKIAGVDLTPDGFITAPAVRNKISMPFGQKDGKVVLGLYRRNSHIVEPIDCKLTGALGSAAVCAVLKFANDKKLPPYNEATGKGLLRHLVIREIGGRASVVLVINSEERNDALESELAASMPDGVDLFICPNTLRNNVILGDSVRLIKGRERLSIDVLGVKAELSPLSFLQVNDNIRDLLYSDAVACITSPVFVDVYSGIGITSNLAAKKCDRVYAVEVVPQAVDDANVTAHINGNANKITNICGRAEDILPSLVAYVKNADVLVDPPRKGCEAGVMAAISGVRPNKLIYISCDNATMCRDIKLFFDAARTAGDEYAFEKCKLFDMFPGTHHTETLVCLKRK